MLPHFSALSIESTVTVLRSYWTTLTDFAQERGMLSTLNKTAVAATTALIISLAPIATADLAFAHGGGGGGSRGGGGGHFDGGGGHVAGGHLAGGRFAGGAFPERGFLATSACLVSYLVTASPTVTHTPTATTIAIDARGPMGETNVGLNQQLAQL
jgi:hypothetical protein